jgi:hypothetical protein
MKMGRQKGVRAGMVIVVGTSVDRVGGSMKDAEGAVRLTVVDHSKCLGLPHDPKHA